MDETRKLCRIAEKKDWGVIENPIEISFFSLDLNREPLHIQDKREVPVHC